MEILKVLYVPCIESNYHFFAVLAVLLVQASLIQYLRLGHYFLDTPVLVVLPVLQKNDNLTQYMEHTVLSIFP